MKQKINNFSAILKKDNLKNANILIFKVIIEKCYMKIKINLVKMT